MNKTINQKLFFGITLVVFGLMAVMTSCSDDPKHPGYEFMPDMYRSPSYETNSMNPLFADSMTQRKPVQGTVARGDALYSDIDRMPYAYPESIEGYEAAGRELKNPLEKTEKNMAAGKGLYENYCLVCHGETGKGDGPVTQRNGPIPPAYSSDALKNLPEGKMYHTVEYGKNMMGSHASQLLPTQRWKIIMYVQTLQNPVGTQAATSDTLKAENTKAITEQTKKG
jgi:mono/diheme cytochrome c family protein